MRRLALGLLTVALAVAAVPADVAAATVETPGVIGEGDGVRQLIQEFVDTSGGDVTAEQIVTFLNGLDERPSGSSTINYGSEYIFNPGSTFYISAAVLSFDKFVVAYTDSSNSGHGTAVIGDVSNSTITYSSEYVFNPAGTNDISATALSANKFVIAYRDSGNSFYGTSIIGNVSGGNISFGSEYVFNLAFTTYISAAALSDEKFVVMYQDGGNSDYGTAIIGNVSGFTVSYGSEYVFNSAGIWWKSSTAALSPNKFLITYTDIGNSDYGTAIIGDVSGNTINYGSEFVFSSAPTWEPSSAALTSTKFVVVYQDGGNSQYGTAIIGDVIGTNVSFGSAYVFITANTFDISAITLTDINFMVAYRDSAHSWNGTAIIGNVSGTNISHSSEYMFNLAETQYISAVSLSSSRFVVAYSDGGNSWNGTAVIGQFPTLTPSPSPTPTPTPTPTASATATATASATATPTATATATPTATATLLPCGYSNFSSTEGGSVIEPCECSYYQGVCYNGGVIDLLAVAEPGYAFTHWECHFKYTGVPCTNCSIDDSFAADTFMTFQLGCIHEVTACFEPVPTPTPTATATAQVWTAFGRRIGGTLVHFPGVGMTFEAEEGSSFIVLVNISHVHRLKIAQYDITYDPSVVTVDTVSGFPDVRAGKIGGEIFAVDNYAFVPVKTQGRVRVIHNIDGVEGKTGAGYLSRIYFHAVGTPGATSPIEIDMAVLKNNALEPIPHTVTNSSVLIITPTPTPTATATASATATATPSATPTPTATPLPGDANGDGGIDAADITKIERIILEGDEETPGADANGDGDVNAADIGVVEYMILEIWPWNHVHIEAPASLAHCNSFTATVFVTYVEGFGSAGFEVSYNAAVLDLLGVSGGRILEIDPGVSAEMHSVAIDDWGLHGGPGAVRINASVGGGGVDGAGYMAQLQFHVNGSAGQGSAIAFNETQSWLRDSLGDAIDATWADDWFTVAP